MENQPQKFKEQFFSQIYGDYVSKIYRFVAFKVDSESIAEDITSEAFTRLWKQIYLEVQVKNPSAFLYKTAKNLLIDHYRAKEKRPGDLGETAMLIKDESQDIEKKAILASDMDQVKKALAQLGCDQAQAVSLYYIEQEPLSEIAKSLGKSQSATRAMIHRGMKQLRNILEA
ncbi:MAG: RNA polymerase sigma factor [Candidatus Pacebacteria bacterium]|nr:RNA polymerase sigma factor [Candidatus Paceibacterota bacterium]